VLYCGVSAKDAGTKENLFFGIRRVETRKALLPQPNSNSNAFPF